MHRLRMLMNAQDSSPGGGAAPPAPAPADQPAPQAQGASGLSLDDLRRELAEFKNSVHADTRRMVEGQLNGKRKAAPAAEPATPAESKAPSEDYKQLRARDRAFERAIRGVQLSDGAAKRMERAFELEHPEDVTAWVSEYIADFNLGKQPDGAPTPTANPSAAASPAAEPKAPAPPAPAPVAVQDLERMNVHPNRLTADQVARLGPKGTLEYVNKYFRKTAP